MRTPAKFKVLSTKRIIIWRFLLFWDGGIIEEIGWYSSYGTKLFFLEESPKILVISKFRCAAIFKVESETGKEPYLRCAWTVADQKNRISPNARYIQYNLRQYYFSIAKIWKICIFVISYLDNVLLRYKLQNLTNWIGISCTWNLEVYNFWS